MRFRVNAESGAGGVFGQIRPIRFRPQANDGFSVRGQIKDLHKIFPNVSFSSVGDTSWVAQMFPRFRLTHPNE
jgi:hypothetical protein